MSESIWFEQVDSALMKLLSNVIRVDGKPVKVVIRKPDEDFDYEDYPLVSIYNIGDKFSDVRYSAEPVVAYRNPEKHFLVLEESALPYDLTYQIDFWATMQSDMNSMTKQWKSYAKSWFNLDTVDDKGTLRSCFVLCKNDFSKADLLKDGKRLFHSFGTYKIQVELDENVQSLVPMLTGYIDAKVDKK